MPRAEHTVNASLEGIKAPKPRIDITGQRFGTLTVNEFVRTSDWNTGWRCKCDCGTERVINGYFLRCGYTSHCGCLTNNTYGPEFTKGHKKRGIAYSCWAGMMSRCFNPKATKYPMYGGCGVTVCERWQDSAMLCADMADRPSKRHTLHRLSNSGHYSCGSCDDCEQMGWPRNVVWATSNTQARLRKSNKLVTYQGETLCMMDMAEKHGISYFVLRNRLSRDCWSVEEAIETPITPDIPVVYKGKEYCVQTLAKLKGINNSMLRSRLRKGWSVEAAVDTPPTPRSDRRKMWGVVIK